MEPSNAAALVFALDILPARRKKEKSSIGAPSEMLRFAKGMVCNAAGATFREQATSD
jgi:hypothetical protein